MERKRLVVPIIVVLVAVASATDGRDAARTTTAREIRDRRRAWVMTVFFLLFTAGSLDFLSKRKRK